MRFESCMGQLSLVDENPIRFVICQWQKNHRHPNVLYLFYRWLLLAVFVATIVVSYDEFQEDQPLAKNRCKWLIYMTNWGLLLNALQALLACIMLTVCCLSTKCQKGVLKMAPFYWFTNLVATDMAMAITILYWSLVYEKSFKVSASMILSHVLNSVLILLDLFMVSHPVYFLHLPYTIIVAVIYMIFNGSYYAAGGTNEYGRTYIYKSIDWRKPGHSIITCLISIILVCLVHGAVWALAELRSAIHIRSTRVQIRDPDDLEMT